MLLFLLACTGAPDDTSGDDTAGSATLPDLAACVLPVAAVVADWSDSVVDGTLSGTVSSAGTGAPPGGCLDRARWMGAGGSDLDLALNVWLVLTTQGGEDWVLSVTSGVFPDPSVLVDQPADLVYHSRLAVPFAGEPAETSVALTTPEFRGWVGIAASVQTLTPVEPLTLGEGAVESTWVDECLDYELRSLTGTDAENTLVASTGETVGFGDTALYSGGVVVASNPRCSETMGGYAGAATWSFPAM